MPDWLAGGGTITALVALGAEVRRNRRANEQRGREERAAEARRLQDAREQQARGVTAWVEATQTEERVQNVHVVVANATAFAVFDVRARPEDLGPLEEAVLPVVSPGQTMRTKSWLAVEVPEGYFFRASVTFSDAHGVRWIRQGADVYELTSSRSEPAGGRLPAQTWLSHVDSVDRTK
ncbi:hypothetical protein [Blastococcus litoris]|uniref:hypothetical protein n=1 Tax=Blastococcus litoris TaxID=2171622 RepID=UPI0013E0B326|nr:hypothetical protein [Blastococcus litoris]